MHPYRELYDPFLVIDLFGKQFLVELHRSVEYQ